MTDRPAALDLTGYLLALLATLACLHLLDSGSLAAPPLLAGTGALRRWLEARDAAAAIFALIRLGAAIVTWYLLATALAALALRMVGALRAATLLDAISLPASRALVQAVAGVSLAASAAGVAGALAGPGAAGAATGRAPSEQAVSMHSLPEEPEGEVVMRRIPDLPGHPDHPSPQAPAPASWTIRAGDHFWSVAEEMLGSAWGRRARDREITTYWRRLVEANRGRLIDAANDDLLIPGQVIELPAPPPAPG